MLHNKMLLYPSNTGIMFPEICGILFLFYAIKISSNHHLIFSMPLLLFVGLRSTY
jgi:hypothetical protein